MPSGNSSAAPEGLTSCKTQAPCTQSTSSTVLTATPKPSGWTHLDQGVPTHVLLQAWVAIGVTSVAAPQWQGGKGAGWRGKDIGCGMHSGCKIKLWAKAGRRIWGVPEWSWELDFAVLVSPFQLATFCDSVTCHFYSFVVTTGIDNPSLGHFICLS